ncbi:nucleotidyl transferase AbiEii/AbiGii toxin family protein [Sulfurimonas sp. CS5]|uniref:nucleotidyl transferase AbiEii/AbiGii toxin family protein n=1 Tax=Sulfurimonas sp. CS5 TaxID=3391145 RepID=UPI0039E8FA81
MLEQMLKKYSIKSDEDYYNALREILQEVALAGLYRGGFFQRAAFYGGTALRSFYKLDRYSEGLDFSLLEPQNDFKLDPYFKAVKDEFEALGIQITIDSKIKTKKSDIESAFLKSNTDVHVLSLTTPIKLNRQIKIKFEVNTNPPLGFDTEEKLLLQPFSFYVKCFASKDLYAGKMHALLFRNWKKRVKGRDWYDFEWYVKNNFILNLDHLTIRAKQSNNLNGKEYFTKELFLKTLKEKIDTLDIKSAKVDIKRFISDEKVLDIWSKDYFKLLADRIQF